MKLKKALKRVTSFLNSERRQQVQEVKALTQLLQTLKQKKAKLKLKMDLELDDEEKARLRAKLDVVNAQRKKGIILLREFRIVPGKT